MAKEKNRLQSVFLSGGSGIASPFTNDNTASPDIFQDGKSARYTQDLHIPDGVGSEIDAKFIPKKQKSSLLGDSYQRIYQKNLSALNDESLTNDQVDHLMEKVVRLRSKTHRVSECGNFLQFANGVNADLTIDEKSRLHKANFCKDRLCPMCAWRRELKMFNQVGEIVQYMEDQKDEYDFDYIFLTLTAPNCVGYDLSATIDRFMKAFDKLMKRREVARVIEGYIRVLEITRNDNVHSKSYDTYHPHYHVLIAVRRSYFKKAYISREKWLKYWQESYQDESITQVDVRRVTNKSKDVGYSNNSLGSAILEIAKYTVKSKDYLIPNNNTKTDEIVETLYNAMYRRKLVKMGGAFADVQKILKQSDVEGQTVDLTHIDEKKEAVGVIAWIVSVFKYAEQNGKYDILRQFIENLEGDVIDWEEVKHIAKCSSEGEPSTHPHEGSGS